MRNRRVSVNSAFRIPHSALHNEVQQPILHVDGFAKRLAVDELLHGPVLERALHDLSFGRAAGDAEMRPNLAVHLDDDLDLARSGDALVEARPPAFEDRPIVPENGPELLREMG